jgi:hypothetical protein
MNISRDIKKIVLGVLCYIATTTVIAGPTFPLNNDQIYGQPLETRESVIAALNGGAIVKAAGDLSKCTRQDGEAPLKLRGGLMVSSYQIKDDGTLLFVDSVYTATADFSGSLEPIADFVKYSVNSEGAITLTSYIYSIPDYTLIRQFAFDCSINNGVSFNASK